MNDQSNSTTVPEISRLIMGTDKPEVVHRLTAEVLRKLPMKDLCSLLHLYTAIDDTVCAFLNQPRFANGNLYNEAGEIGDALLDHLNWCVSLIEQVAKDAKPTTPEEAEVRAWLLINRAAGYSDNLADFVAVAAHLSVAASRMEGV